MDAKAPVSEPWHTSEAQVRAWIQAVLRTTFIRSSRRQRRVRTHEVPEPWGEGAGSWMDQLIADDNEQRWTDRILLDDFVRSLRARERMVVFRLLQGDSEVTIAGALHVTSRTVRRIRARMRDRFRTQPPSSS